MAARAAMLFHWLLWQWPRSLGLLFLGPQALLFLTLRRHLLRNTLRSFLGGSAIRPLMILLCSALVWAFVFSVSYEGFSFLKSQKLAPTDRLVGIILDLLFLSLGVLLIFSTGLILYSSLFAAAETAFLLSKPIAADQVFAYKFQGAMLFSSWAFLLLGGPILIAFGLVAEAPWYFYLILPLFFLGFVLLPSSLGALLCLLIVNYVPRRRKQLLTAAIVLVALGAVLWGWQVIHSVHTESSLDREAVTKLLNWFSFARSALAPSHWVASGLRAAARGDLDAAWYFLVLVWCNGLLLYLASAFASVRLYRRGFNRLATGGTLRKRFGHGGWMDRLLNALLFAANERTRLLIIKDFRTFRRDPQQWAQILIFSGLMVLYFTNIRRMFPGDLTWMFQNAISLLNLCAIALLLCTYTGRFVYPLLSLEGRKFWILGLLPLDREQLLWGKFAFATTMTLALAEILTILSDVMLAMPPLAMLVHALTVLVLAGGLSGLSVGLGAWMPNFRETDPSKIAVGFGGTLNLVVCLVFLLATMVLMAGPWHFLAAANTATEVPEMTWPSYALIGCGLTAGLALGSAAIFIPLQIGVRTLRTIEF
jgi:ABC-2 type transport system permease protein